jgi:DNA-binding response OmpR family regulator
MPPVLLIINDDPAGAVPLASALRAAGYEPHLVQAGPEVPAAASKVSPTLAIVVEQMADSSTLAALRAWRPMLDASGARVVLHTQLPVDFEFISDAADVGIDEYWEPGMSQGQISSRLRRLAPFRSVPTEYLTACG